MSRPERSWSRVRTGQLVEAPSKLLVQQSVCDVWYSQTDCCTSNSHMHTRHGLEIQHVPGYNSRRTMTKIESVICQTLVKTVLFTHAYRKLSLWKPIIYCREAYRGIDNCNFWCFVSLLTNYLITGDLAEIQEACDTNSCEKMFLWKQEECL